jgi:peptide/nickel transport system substrate-binding protein
LRADKRLLVGRRRLIAMLGAGASAAVLAACQAPSPATPAASQPAGSTPAAGTTAKPAAAETPKPAADAAKPAATTSGGGKVFNGAWPFELPPAGHFNTYIAKNTNLGIYWELMQQPFGMYYWGTGKWMPLMATEWKMAPPDKLEVMLRPGVKWSNGTDVTVDDVITTFMVEKIEQATLWRYIDKIETAGNKITFHMNNPSTVVERYVIRSEQIQPHAIFGEWAKKVTDLVAQGKESGSEEFKKLRADFQQFRPKEMLSTGPFKLDVASMTESQLTLVKNPLGWNASAIGFDKIVLYNGETATITPLVLAKEIDYATHAFPPATEKAFVDGGVRVIRAPVYNGAALLFNYATMKAVAPKEVRQAIAHAIKREDAATVALGKSAVPPKFMAGFSDSLVPLWISEADQKKLNPYEYNPQKAEAMLKEIGYTKGADGVWVSKDGERMEYELAVPAEYADSSAAAISVGEQLTRFGIKTTVRTVTFTQFPVELDAGKYQMAVDLWGAAQPHPHFSFDVDFFVRNIKAAGGGIKFPLKQTTSQGEVDLEKMVVESAKGLDPEPQKALVTRMALAFNELLPKIPIYERYGNNPVMEGARVKGWPKDDDMIYRNSPYADSIPIMLMYEGRLQPA